MSTDIINFKDFINNPTLAAFIGAFSAFFLVQLSDYFKRRKKIKTIYAQIRIILKLSIDKKNVLEENFELAQAKHEITPAPIIKFQTDYIRAMKIEVLDILDEKTALCIDSICYQAEATDEILADILKLCNELEKLVEKQQIALLDSEKNVPRIKFNKLINSYNEAIKNMSNISNTCKLFLDKEYDQILS